MLAHERKGRLLIKLALIDDEKQMQEGLKSRYSPQVVSGKEIKPPQSASGGLRPIRRRSGNYSAVTGLPAVDAKANLDNVRFDTNANRWVEDITPVTKYRDKTDPKAYDPKTVSKRTGRGGWRIATPNTLTPHNVEEKVNEFWRSKKPTSSGKPKVPSAPKVPGRVTKRKALWAKWGRGKRGIMKQHFIKKREAKKAGTFNKAEWLATYRRLAKAPSRHFGGKTTDKGKLVKIERLQDNRKGKRPRVVTYGFSPRDTDAGITIDSALPKKKGPRRPVVHPLGDWPKKPKPTPTKPRRFDYDTKKFSLSREKLRNLVSRSSVVGDFPPSATVSRLTEPELGRSRR